MAVRMVSTHNRSGMTLAVYLLLFGGLTFCAPFRPPTPDPLRALPRPAASYCLEISYQREIAGPVLLSPDHRAAVDHIYAWGQPCRAERYDDRRWVERDGRMVVEVREATRYVPCLPRQATHVRTSRWTSAWCPGDRTRGTTRVEVTSLGQWCAAVVHCQRSSRRPRGQGRGWFCALDVLRPVEEDAETMVCRLGKKRRE